jgi:hypothetical protein
MSLNIYISSILLIFGLLILTSISGGSDQYICNANACCIDIYLRGATAANSYADVYLDQINYLGRTDENGYLRAIIPPGYHRLFATKYVYQINKLYEGSGSVTLPVTIITMEGSYTPS